LADISGGSGVYIFWRGQWGIRNCSWAHGPILPQWTTPNKWWITLYHRLHWGAQWGEQNFYWGRPPAPSSPFELPLADISQKYGAKVRQMECRRPRHSANMSANENDDKVDRQRRSRVGSLDIWPDIVADKITSTWRPTLQWRTVWRGPEVTGSKVKVTLCTCLSVWMPERRRYTFRHRGVEDMAGKT